MKAEEKKGGSRHEALNLLMVIEISCAKLSETLAEPEPLRREVDRIQAATSRLKELMREGGRALDAPRARPHP